jgi:hypothetical protein
MRQPIELRRVRDFGQVINDSFAFFKEHLKPLFASLLIICGFFIVLSCITNVSTHLKMSDMYSGKLENLQNGGISYVVSVLINLLVVIIEQSCIHLVTLCYISVYLQKGNVKPTFAEVWGYFKYYFFRVFWASIVVFFLSAIGFVFCIIPGIYLLPILSLVIPAIVIENASFSYAFNKSFRLIKENWWQVFGILFIMSLIVGVANSFAEYPITIIAMGERFLSLKGFKIPLIIFFSIMRSILVLTYVLPGIAVAICYLNLTEQKEGVGLLSRIEKFGMTVDEKPDLPTEEY